MVKIMNGILTISKAEKIKDKFDAVGQILEYIELNRKGIITFFDLNNNFIEIIYYLSKPDFSIYEEKRIEAIKLVTIMYNTYIASF